LVKKYVSQTYEENGNRKTYPKKLRMKGSKAYIHLLTGIKRGVIHIESGKCKRSQSPNITAALAGAGIIVE
jgi:hypothetical protein